MVIQRPGIYPLSEQEYHADPCPSPSLSSSIARTLISQSALHAWFEHPKLNPAHQAEEDDKFDVGTAAHAYLLQGESRVAVLNYRDWRTNDAKAAKALARKEGKIPLLADRWGEIQAMAEAVRRQLELHEEPPRPLSGGRPELTLVWQEDGIWCRARLDWLHDNERTIDDLKTTEGSAQPDAWIRNQLYGNGYDVQAAFYLRGLRAVLKRDGVFRFVAAESRPPYAASVIGLAPEALELGHKKVEHAIAAWRHCLESGTWPGYPTRTCWAEVPAWESARWLEQSVRAPGVYRSPVVDDGRPLDEQLFGPAV